MCVSRVSTVASPKEKPYYCDAILSTGIDRLDLPTYDPEALMANYEELQEAARIHQAQLQAQQYQQAARDSNWGQPPVPGLEDETPEAQAYDATAGGGDDTWTQAADGSWSQPGGVSWMQQADASSLDCGELIRVEQWDLQWRGSCSLLSSECSLC